MEPTALQQRQLERLGLLPHTAEKAALIQSYVQGSAEWHAERMLRLGASEVGAIGTHAPAQERSVLLAARRQGPAAPSAAMQRGQRLEPVLAERFTAAMQARERVGTRLAACPSPVQNARAPHPTHRIAAGCPLQEKTGEAVVLQRGGLLVDPRSPWLSASPDYVWEGGGGAVTLVELKSWREVPPEDALPATVRWQVVMQMGIAAATIAAASAAAGTLRAIVYVVPVAAGAEPGVWELPWSKWRRVWEHTIRPQATMFYLTVRMQCGGGFVRQPTTTFSSRYGNGHLLDMCWHTLMQAQPFS